MLKMHLIVKEIFMLATFSWPNEKGNNRCAKSDESVNHSELKNSNVASWHMKYLQNSIKEL